MTTMLETAAPQGRLTASRGGCSSSRDVAGGGPFGTGEPPVAVTRPWFADVVAPAATPSTGRRRAGAGV